MNLKYNLLVFVLILLAGCESGEVTYMVGTLERDRVEVSVESNEPILAIHVTDGQMLKAGDLILEQDPARLEILLAQQKATANQAAARLAELKRGPREETIREARALLESAEASAVNASDNLKRARDIFERKLSDQQSLDFAITRWKTTSAAEKAARESLERLLNGTTIEELQQAEAALESAEAGMTRIQYDIGRLKTYAPVDGMLDKRLYQVGERPNTGATIAVMLDTSRTYARIYVPEPLKSSVLPGKQLSVRIDGAEDNISGTVKWVSSDASFTPYFALTQHDRSRLSYLAEVDVPEAANLPVGLPLQVDFPAGTGAND
jgi:HlyD family secretion protein